MADQADTSAAGGGKVGSTVGAVGKSASPTTVGTRKRSTPGKQFFHGADRVVRYYKITEAEVDRLGELSTDEKAAWARMSFCLGLAVNAALGLLFGGKMSNGTVGAAVAPLVLSLLVAGVFFFDARKKRDDGKSAFDKIRDDHDFTNV